jgi:hypothetical protein
MSAGANGGGGTGGFRRRLTALLAVLVIVSSVGALAATVTSGLSATRAGADVYTNNGDNARDGWYPDEPNLSPTSITSGDFGQLFSTQLDGAVYGQPLVDNGVLVVTTEADWIYGLDPVSGAILWSRNIGTAFNEGSQEGCGDLLLSGITATPVVDPSTGIVYFTDKQYVTGDSGAAQYWLHAVNPQTGAEEPNFPVLYQGPADDDPTQSFNAYYQDQRPGLLLLGGVVYAAFGSTCDYGTYEGWVIGVNTSGKITTRWSDEAGQGQTAQAGIWQSGSGIMSDGAGTMVVVTSNGNTPPTPVAGTSPPDALGQSVVRLNVQSNGTLKPVDFFTPTNAAQLSTIDADFGSGGAVELPPSTFSTSKYPEVIAAIGKEGYLYLLNGQNLGGYGQGANGGNADIARIGPLGGVWGKTAVWPGNGGYAYVVTASQGGGPGVLQALAWSTDANGNPTLSQVGTSSDAFGYGSSAPAVTSNGTATGSATLWTVWSASDAPEGGSGGSESQLRAYNPVPVNGSMQEVWSAPIGVASKFLTPDFSNGRVYVGNINGQIFGFGAPVPQPLSVSPTSFPTTAVGQSTTQSLTISSTAAVTITGITSDDGDFTVGAPSSTLPVSLPAGGSMTVPVTFTPSQALPDAAVLTITMQGGALSQQAIGLSGTGQYATGHPLLTPQTIDFGNVALNSSAQSESAVLTNNGAQPLTITGVSLPAAPYSLTTVPAAGTTIAPGANIAIPVTFTPDVVGNSLTSATVDTNDGDVTLDLTGGTGYPSSLEVGPQTVDFGSVPLGTTEDRTFTVTNTGATAAAITLSKPPVTSAGFAAVSALPEDTTIAAGATVTETVSFTPPTTGAATDQWILDGTDGLGKRVVTFVGTGASPPPPAVSVSSLNTYWPLAGTTGTANFTVSLSWPTSTAVTVTANTADGTDTAAGGDYVPVTNQTVTIPAGATTATVPVTIEPNGGKHSGPSAFSLLLSNPVGAAAGTMTGQGNIVFGGEAVNEFMSASAAVVSQSLTTAQTAEVPVTVKADTYAANCIVNTADGTATAASGAYVPIVGGVVTLKAGQASTTIPVTIPAAPTPTGNETFTVNLSDCNTGSIAAAPSATVTIVGAAGGSPAVEESPSIIDFGSVPDNVTETRTFTLTNTGGSPATITSSVPPAAGSGFAATTGIPAGSVLAPGASATETVAFTPTSQGALAASWTVNANDGLGARTVTLLGTGLTPLTPAVSVNWLNLVRPSSGTATANFTLSLSSPSPVPVSVTVRTLDGTATVANGDYVAVAPKLVTFAPGQTTTTVPVTVNGKVATHSYFGLQLVAPDTGVVIQDDYGRANLLGPSDAAHEFVYAGTASVIQTTTAAQTAELPVTSSAHSDTITCTVNTADGTAVAASGDYDPIVNGSVTLAPGQTAATVPVVIPPGTNIQPNRQFTVTIGTCTNSNDVAEDPTGVVTINGVQPPAAPVVTTSPISQSVQSGTPVTFTAAATGSPTPTVQWMSEAPGATTYSAVSGATGLSYTLSPAFAQSGTKFEAVFTNTLGSATTNAATLTVTPGLSLALSPSSLAFGSVPDGVTETHTFTVTNTGSAAVTVTASAPPTAGTGFTAVSTLAPGTTIAAGASVVESVAFTPSAQGALSDSWSITANDGQGAHVLALSGTGAAPVTPTASINWINLVRPTSGTATATFTLSLSSPSPTATSVTVRTLDGTATVANGDYVALAPKLVTFAPGQVTATVAVTVNGKVATHSYFGLQIVGPNTGVVVVNDYGRANLLGPSDSAHEFLYAGTTAVVQTTTDAQTAELPITSSAHTDTITCAYSTADGTATVANGDYVPVTNGSFTLSPGQTVTFIPLTIPTGVANQPNRSFTVTLGTCTNSNDVVADPVGTVQIIG